MTQPTLDDLRSTWTVRPGFSTRREVIDMIADGRPATPEALVAATGRSLDDVTALIDESRRRGAEVENGAIVGATACPVTGATIRLTVEADGTASQAAPDGVVVGIVGEQVTSCCTTTGPLSEVCTQMPFFAFRDAGERWQADHPGVAIVDLDDARSIAHAYVDSRT